MKRRFASGPMMVQQLMLAQVAGLVALWLSEDPDRCFKKTQKKPLHLCDFSGGGGSGPLPLLSLDPRILLLMAHQSVWTSRISVSSSCPIGFKAGST